MNEAEDNHSPSDPRDRETLLYDYFKHLTSLALLTLGGILALSQAADKQDVKPAMVIIVLGITALSAVVAFGGTSEIVRARYLGDATDKRLNLCRVTAPGLLALAVGMFLFMFADSLT
jgi:hypothetical protein